MVAFVSFHVEKKPRLYERGLKEGTASSSLRENMLQL
jgi:hypothetical protein